MIHPGHRGQSLPRQTPPIRTLIAAEDGPIFSFFRQPGGGVEPAPEIGGPLHRLGPEKRVVWRGGDRP